MPETFYWHDYETFGASPSRDRPVQFAGDTSPDIEWIEHAIAELGRRGRTWDAFSLLRPTSPFRTADTIRRAWAPFTAPESPHSPRAVRQGWSTHSM